jgi:hypothetical protein
MVEVGKYPTSPMMVVGPVLVIPEPARTPKLEACPSKTGASAPESWDSVSAAAMRMNNRGLRVMIFSKDLRALRIFIGQTWELWLAIHDPYSCRGFTVHGVNTPNALLGRGITERD